MTSRIRMLQRQLKQLRPLVTLAIGDAIAAGSVSAVEGPLEHFQSIGREASELLGLIPVDRHLGLTPAASIQQLAEDVDRRLEQLAITTLLTAPIDPHGDFVYILWNREQRPLYIGKSTNIFGRLGTHMQEAQKRSLTAKVSVLRCADADTADVVEARLIAIYRPPLNVAGLDGRSA